MKKQDRRCTNLFVLALALALPGPGAQAQDAASITTYKPSSGLVLWLDASKQNQERENHGFPGLLSGDLVGVCFDSSPNRRLLRQRQSRSQPKFISKQGFSVLRFDGEDDFLDCDSFGLDAKELTIYLVATPTKNPGGFRACSRAQPSLAKRLHQRPDDRSERACDSSARSDQRRRRWL